MHPDFQLVGTEARRPLLRSPSLWIDSQYLGHDLQIRCSDWALRNTRFLRFLSLKQSDTTPAPQTLLNRPTRIVATADKCLLSFWIWSSENWTKFFSYLF